jgi:hypothetical protein
MQQDEVQLGEVLRSQSNDQSEMEFCYRFPVLSDVFPGSALLRELSYLEYVPYLNFTPSISDTVIPMTNKGVRFKEVIRAPLWLLAFVYFLFLSMVLSIWAALGNTPALITFGVLTLWLIYLYFKTALKIEVDQTHLRVGGASIEHKFIGEVTVLSSSEVKLIRTRDADPLAYLAIRFWSSKAIKLQVSDARDKTPYWLITTNNGQELLKALKS